MGFLTWIYGKGLAGAISRDLIKKFLGIKKQHPLEEDTDILKRVWSFWLTLNEGPIRKHDKDDKISRLDLIKESKDREGIQDDIEFESLITLYRNILYIETDIGMHDKKTFDRCLKVFVNEGKKQGLDFTKDYEDLTKLLTYLNI